MRGLVLVGAWFLMISAFRTEPARAQDAPADSDSLVYFGTSPGNAGAAGVLLPSDRATVWLAALGPPIFNERAQPGTRERYGDTRIQAAGILGRIEDELRALGLTLGDVIFLRAYLVADPRIAGMDVDGWNQTYEQFFGTETNPNRPPYTTVQVAGLPVPDWLIQVEAIAARPE